MDFIADFMELTEGALSPDLFRRWSAIALVAGALERRVWTRTGPRQTFANLYTLLVAPPGVGKYIVEEVRELWEETLEPGGKAPAFHVAPDSMTKASLIDALAKSKQVRLTASGPPVEYHSLLVAAEEFGVLMPAYDTEYIGVLNGIYNNKPYHAETRRTGSVREVRIVLPQLNILAGTQPGWLASTFPEEAWSTGLTSRILMVYCPDVPMKDIFAETADTTQTRQRVLSRLAQMSQMFGELTWGEGAAGRLGAWHLAGGPPTPRHSKLTNYTRRRTLHAIKLAMVSSVSRGTSMTIELIDVDRALAWLFEIEALMPDIFRAMVGRSDAQVMEELHYFVSNLFNLHGKKPIHERELISFLSQRVPSDKVGKILEMAERSGEVERQPNTTMYVPKVRHSLGVE